MGASGVGHSPGVVMLITSHVDIIELYHVSPSPPLSPTTVSSAGSREVKASLSVMILLIVSLVMFASLLGTILRF